MAFLRYLPSVALDDSVVFGIIHHVVPFVGILGMVVELLRAVVVLNEAVTFGDDGVITRAEACTGQVGPLGVRIFQ